MPVAISIRNLKEIIIERLKQTKTPREFEIIKIPSDEWIRLQFWPRNSYHNSAMQYTGAFRIKYVVQTRLLHKYHVDIHYCSALFRYMRLFAIRFRSYVCTIFADDKHKIPIGEKVAVSTGVRNKRTLGSMDINLSACDHDFTKCSITPSVSLICNVPKDISESFYSGQVYVSYKDSIFQPSSAIRHATEWLSIMKNQYLEELPEIALIYTDGGADHRNTFGSVQLSLICLFLHGDFDFLAALRTAPYHSWMNPAERVMSVLNLGLQGVALQRDEMDKELENIFKSLNTLEEIRETASQNLILKNELKTSINKTQTILEERTKYLKLKDNNFECFQPATDSEIDEFFEV